MSSRSFFPADARTEGISICILLDFVSSPGKVRAVAIAPLSDQCQGRVRSFKVCRAASEVGVFPARRFLDFVLPMPEATKVCMHVTGVFPVGRASVVTIFHWTEGGFGSSAGGMEKQFSVSMQGAGSVCSRCRWS